MRSSASASASRAGAAGRLGLLTGAVAYSWLAGGLRENTLPAAVAVMVPGIAAAVVARRGHPAPGSATLDQRPGAVEAAPPRAEAPDAAAQPEGHEDRQGQPGGEAPATLTARSGAPAPADVDPRGATVWGLWLLAFLLWEAGAFLFQESPTVGNDDHPTLSLLMDPLLQQQPVRALGYLAWLVGGWRLLRR